MGNYLGFRSQNGDKIEVKSENSVSLKEMNLGSDQIPRCITWISPTEDRIGVISIPDMNIYDQLMEKSTEGDRNYFYIFIQSKDTLIQIKSKKLEETIDEQEIKLDFDRALFFKEFDSDEKMHSLLDYLRKIANVEKPKPSLKANINPLVQADLNTKVVLPKDLLREEEYKFVEERLLANEACLNKWIESVLKIEFPSELTKKRHPRIGTSGSIWFMTDWLKNGQIYPDIERDVFNKEASNSDYIDGLFRIWLRRNLPNQEITNSLVLENWTNALGFAYFGEKWYTERVNFRLSDITLDSTQHPWPIMTAIARSKGGVDLWDYCEFTPTYVSKASSQYGIKTTSFGNKIGVDGIKKHLDICSDELGQMMATWGSAMCAEKELVSTLIQATCGSFGRFLFDEIFRNYSNENLIFNPFEAPNWDPTELEQHDTLEFRDSGFLTNVPLPVLLEPERKLDIIIALDSTEDIFINPYQNIGWVQLWAKKNNVPFPEIPLFDLGKLDKWREPQLFEPTEVGAPAILFLPVALDPLISTFKFHYSPLEREQITKKVEELWQKARLLLASYSKKNFC